MAQGLQPGDPRKVGPYELTGVLGSGGMGQVFLGRSVGGRPVAVKVIRAELADDPEFRNRFRREVAAARKVNGMFTALVADADADGPLPWLATAYVPGPSLAQAVAEHGPLPAGAVLALTAGLAEGLAAIHAAGVVHRDLKPSNVLLAADGPRVIDFGISRAAENSALTHTGLVMGSPGFMSPEQAEGGEIGLPSDLFSLGAVLAFAATGQGPFGDGSTAALVYRVVHGSPSLEQVPDIIRPLIERCLDKDPARRPTASDLLRETSTSQPTAGWLPEPVISAFAQDDLPGRTDEAHTVTAMSLSARLLNTVRPQLLRDVVTARAAQPGTRRAGPADFFCGMPRRRSPRGHSRGCIHLERRIQAHHLKPSHSGAVSRAPALLFLLQLRRQQRAASRGGRAAVVHSGYSSVYTVDSPNGHLQETYLPAMGGPWSTQDLSAKYGTPPVKPGTEPVALTHDRYTSVYTIDASNGDLQETYLPAMGGPWSTQDLSAKYGTPPTSWTPTAVYHSGYTSVYTVDAVGRAPAGDVPARPR